MSPFLSSLSRTMSIASFMFTCKRFKSSCILLIHFLHGRPLLLITVYLPLYMPILYHSLLHHHYHYHQQQHHYAYYYYNYYYNYCSKICVRTREGSSCVFLSKSDQSQMVRSRNCVDVQASQVRVSEQDQLQSARREQ